MLVEQLQHAEARIGRAGRPIHHRDARELRRIADRSEEHTSELQSPMNLVWRLLLEKKSPSVTWASARRGTICFRSMPRSLSHPSSKNERSRFFFKDPATTQISTLSLHAALPI